MKNIRSLRGLVVCGLALLAIAAQAAGVDVPGFLAAHTDVVAGLGMLAMAGELTLEDLRPALLDFTKSATAKIDAATSLMETESKERVTKQSELVARLGEVEQKLDRRGSGSIEPFMDGGSGMLTKLLLTKLLSDDEGIKLVRSGRSKSTKVDLPSSALHHKAALTSTSVGGVPLIEVDRRPDIVALPLRKLTIRDILNVFTTTSGALEYLRETAGTNAAAIVAEGELKPESTLGFELVPAAVVTVATWLHASKQILDDVPKLQSFIETRLTYKVRLTEEQQLLKGSGVGNNLLGLYTGATAFVAPVVIADQTPLDVLRLAIGQLEDANFNCTAFVLHPDDWTVIELLKNADGDYLKSNPSISNVRSVWGRPVVTTTAMTVGTFLAGDFAVAASLYDRQEPTLEIATMDQDDFVRNLIKVRVEERISLTLELPGAMVKGLLDPP